MKRENRKFYISLLCCGLLLLTLLGQEYAIRREREGTALSHQQKGERLEELEAYCTELEE